jgi:hypothetical protein
LISRSSIDKNALEQIVLISTVGDSIDMKFFFSGFGDLNFSLNPSFKFEFWDIQLQFLHKNDEEFINLAMNVHISVTIKWCLLEINNNNLSFVLWSGCCNFSHFSGWVNSH